MSWLARAWEWIWSVVLDHKVEAGYALFGVAAALVRAAGVTVVSGTTALKFSFGRATRELHPGFHLLFPFLQVARVLPTRSRTIDLATQRVTTLDGLVYTVDANLVYRVVDVRRALIQIDRLERGMLQMLGLGVQEVLRSRERSSLRVSEALDRDLAENLARRLEPWGVSVEHAGFPTITPSAETLRLTQLAALGATRARALALLTRGGAPRPQALALLGPRQRFLSRSRRLRERDRQRARQRRLQALLTRTELELEDQLEALARTRRPRTDADQQRREEDRRAARDAALKKLDRSTSSSAAHAESHGG